MKFSNDRVLWYSAEPYATTRVWHVWSLAYRGTGRLYVKFKDVAGNWSPAYYVQVFPEAPSNLTAIKLSGGKGARLSWRDNSANETPLLPPADVSWLIQKNRDHTYAASLL